MLWQILTLLLAVYVMKVFMSRWKYDLHKVPSPPGLPILGHTLEFFYGQPSYQIAQWIGRRMRQLGKTKLMRVNLMGTPMLFVQDINFIREVMYSKTASFPRWLPGGGFFIPMIGGDANVCSLLVNEKPTAFVKACRKAYANAFQSKQMRADFPKLNRVIDKMCEIIDIERKDGKVNFQSLSVQMTLDIIGEVAFDVNLGGLDGSRKAYEYMLKTGYVARLRFQNPFNRLYCLLFPHSKEAKRQDDIIATAAAEWSKLTQEILDKEAPKNGEEPIWYSMRNLIDPKTNKPVSFNSLRADLATVVVTGTDTTGHQIGWIFGLLAASPHVVQKILDECTEHGLYGPNARDVAFEDLGELTYLTAVIKEGLRMAYIVPQPSIRYVPEDMTIFGYRIPKGTPICPASTRSMYTEEEWGDPKVFRPERWLTGEDMTNKYSLAFACGPRDCIGQKLAMVEMRLAIFRILTRYKITIDPNEMQDIIDNARDGLVTEARGGIWLDVQPRSVNA